jgi:hypothetical protein
MPATAAALLCQQTLHHLLLYCCTNMNSRSTIIQAQQGPKPTQHALPLAA